MKITYDTKVIDKETTELGALVEGEPGNDFERDFSLVIHLAAKLMSKDYSEVTPEIVIAAMSIYEKLCMDYLVGHGAILISLEEILNNNLPGSERAM